MAQAEAKALERTSWRRFSHAAHNRRGEGGGSIGGGGGRGFVDGSTGGKWEKEKWEIVKQKRDLEGIVKREKRL